MTQAESLLALIADMNVQIRQLQEENSVLRNELEGRNND